MSGDTLSSFSLTLPLSSPLHPPSLSLLSPSLPLPPHPVSSPSTSSHDVHQSYDPLTECHPGQLCVAQFSQDGRWYRAVIVSTPSPGMATFFFLDHGGSEEASISSLYPLPDHFRALPFQMIHVKLTTDSSINFNTREVGKMYLLIN